MSIFITGAFDISTLCILLYCRERFVAKMLRVIMLLFMWLVELIGIRKLIFMCVTSPILFLILCACISISDYNSITRAISDF